MESLQGIELHKNPKLLRCTKDLHQVLIVSRYAAARYQIPRKSNYDEVRWYEAEVRYGVEAWLDKGAAGTNSMEGPKPLQIKKWAKSRR